MASQVEICNLALARIGHQQRIASINDDTATARALKALYDQTRQYILRERPWPFAQRYETLGLVVNDPNMDWAYAYRYPNGYLKVYQLRAASSSSTVLPSTAYREYTPSFAQAIPWQMSSDTQGRLIFTNLADAIAIGTYDVSDEGQFDPQFVDAFAWRLAYEMAPSLTKDYATTDRAMAKYEQAIQLASASALNESFRDQPESEFVTSGY